MSHENTMSKNFGLLLRGGHINLIGAGTALALISFQEVVMVTVYTL